MKKLSIRYFVLVIMFETSHLQILDTYYLLNSNDFKCETPSSSLVNVERERSLTDYTIFTTAFSHAKDVNPLLYICSYDYVVPNGRFIDYGGVSFYFPRLRISRLECGQTLTIIGGSNSTSLFEKLLTSAQKFIFTCLNTPVIFNSENRFLRFFWNNHHKVDYNVTIELTNYVRFSKNYSIAQQRDKCVFRQKFWCANETEVCLTSRAVCNGYDDCFDGGSDEIAKCHLMRDNNTIRHEHSAAWPGWPWIALILLPIILICALARICSQKRQLDIDEDYEYKRSCDSSDDQEDDSCDLHLNEQQLQPSADCMKSDGFVVPSAPTEPDFHRNITETGYAYPYGPPMSVSAEYCHSDEKASTSTNWMNDKCAEEDECDDVSNPPTPPPRYDESMMFLSSTSVSQSAISNRSSYPNAHGQNIYVISPDTTMVVSPPRKQHLMTSLVGDSLELQPGAAAQARFQMEVCAQMSSFHEDNTEAQEGTSLLITSAISHRSPHTSSSTKALLSEEDYSSEEGVNVNGMNWKSTYSKEKSESCIEMETLAPNSDASFQASTFPNYGGAKSKLLDNLTSNATHSNSNGESGSEQLRGLNSVEKTTSSYDKHYVLV